MAHGIRVFVLALATAATLVANAAPARAVGESLEPDAVPVMRDVPMRLLGIVLTAGGFVTFCAASPIIAITRPTDFGKAWRALVVTPVKFTWVDPLGRHPERPDADFGDTSPAAGSQAVR
jgi:hypothetical protein